MGLEDLRSALLPLLPAGVEVAAWLPATPARDPFPEECALVENAVAVRQREFHAGRSAARAALTRLGIPVAPLLADVDRVPIWPQGVVGSLSHSRTLCVAIVARSSHCRSLGVDLEPDEPLESKLWRRILTPSERQRLDARQPETRGRLARLVFSAKECFYKCQYPLTRRFLGFQDVEVELGPEADRFRAIPRVDLGPTVAAADGIDGRWIAMREHLITCMALPPEGPHA
jgi:4'-phosphopantetheinyl transferase EntD